MLLWAHQSLLLSDFAACPYSQWLFSVDVFLHERWFHFNLRWFAAVNSNVAVINVVHVVKTAACEGKNCRMQDVFLSFLIAWIQRQPPPVDWILIQLGERIYCGWLTLASIHTILVSPPPLVGTFAHGRYNRVCVCVCICPCVCSCVWVTHSLLARGHFDSSLSVDCTEVWQVHH